MGRAFRKGGRAGGGEGCEVRAVRSAVAFRLSREVSDERSGWRAIEHAAACKVAFKSCALCVDSFPFDGTVVYQMYCI